ncbi:M56 family metallopeptidase [Luteibacter sp. 9133]|uniref:M56 family metallopeptidase n=1 Tax=Luteibacter sp. 9133 TaxID=1500891 RepID=UPI0005BE889B|nr:M56 family metallopeptidase [Luteibacter sp. 9133]
MNPIATVIAFSASLLAGAGMLVALRCVQDGLQASTRYRLTTVAFWLTAVLPAALLIVNGVPGTMAEQLSTQAMSYLTALLPDALSAQTWLLWVANGLLMASSLWGMRAIAHLVRALRRTRTLRRAAVPSMQDDIPVLVAEVPSPLLIGYRDPAVIVPASVRAYPPAVIAALVRHERAHAHRRDNWHLLLESWAMALMPWCLPLRSLHQALLAAREELCDEAALLGTDDATRRGYGQALIDALRQSQIPSAMGSTVAGPLPALRRRMAAILDPGQSYRAPDFRHWIAALLAVALGWATAVSAWRVHAGIETVAGLHGMTLRFLPVSSSATNRFHVTTLGAPVTPDFQPFHPGDYRVSFTRAQDGSWVVATSQP